MTSSAYYSKLSHNDINTIQYILLVGVVVPEMLPLAVDGELVRVATWMTQHYFPVREVHLSVLPVAGHAVHCCHYLVEQSRY